jgi:hypothetical protein
MKKLFTILLAAGAMLTALAHAAPAAGWDTAVRAVDDTYWAAYNHCDLAALRAMNSDDLEFYHDTGGVMHGKAAFDQAMSQNICGNPAVHVRREAIPGTVLAFPLTSNGTLYGAVIEGRHRFYDTAPGKSDVPSGQARFTSLYLLEDGAWKMARVLSYDHTPAQPASLPAEVQVAPGALAMLAGTYTATDKTVLHVTAQGQHLIVLAGGATFELFPTSPHNFAMKERAITVAFTVDASGRGQALVVRERGAVVAQAVAAQ